MKLKRLQIKNIASIVETNIDFTKAPLADDPIFLITGETGSGKTTILNSICIALYNAVPAFAVLEGKRTADVDGVNLGSPLQLVRRECREASIVLDFIGPDGKNYTIEWCNSRHRKRTSGLIDDKTSRILKCHDDGKSWESAKEMNSVVENVIGYTFEQFCRTTMLAQGQFLRFINSNTEDKTDILEKLTGTEIYSEVGKQIFLIAKEHSENLKDLQKQIDALELPSDEETQGMADQIAALEAAIAEQEKREKELETHEKWLDEAAKCQANLEKSKAELAAWQSEERMREIEALKSTVANWNETAEIRRITCEALDVNSEINAKNDEISTLRRRFASVCQGLAYLRALSAKLDGEAGLIGKRVEASAPLLPLINGCERACALVSALADNKEKIETAQTQIEQYSRSIEGKAAEQAKLVAKQAELERELQEKSKAVDCLSAELDKLKLADLRKKIDDSQKRKELLANARNAVAKLQNEIGELGQLRDELAAKQRALAELEASIAAGRENLAALKISSDQARRYYQGKADLASKLAELTQVFAQEKQCPLCGSRVDHLHTRDILDQETAKAKAAAEAAERELAAAKDALCKIEQEAGVLSTLIARTAASVKSKESEKVKAETAAKQAAAQAGVDLSSPSILVEIDAEIDAVAGIITVINGDLDRGLEMQKQCNDAVKLRDDFKKKADKLRDEAAEMGQAIDKLRIMAKSTAEGIEERKAENAEKLASLAELLPETAPAEAAMLRKDAPAGEIMAALGQAQACIRKLKNDYDLLCAKRDELKAKRASVDEAIGNTELTLKGAEATLGHPSGGLEPKEMAGIEEEARRLCAQANNLSGQIQTLGNRAAALGGQERQYYASHSKEETRKMLDALAGETPKTISDKSGKISDYATELVRLKAVVDKGGLDLEVIMEKRPKDLPAELTLQQAKDDKAAAHQELIGLRDSRTAKKVEHERVKERKEMSIDLEKKRDEASKLSEKWDRLASVFGDAKGKTFRTIAQSFIFHELLRIANEYLAQLLPRYELDSDSGENMFIYVIDHNEGDSRRLVNSLSGGEGFIASLALALALSAINCNKEQVDTLFIDEGFGSLSDELLVMVIDMLCRLQNETGRRVAVISHMPYLKERIQTQIRVEQAPGASSSTISIVS